LTRAVVRRRLCGGARSTVEGGNRAIGRQLESTKGRINELLAGLRDAPIPEQVAGIGSFGTAASGINYWFLRKVWEAASAAEIEVLAEKAVSLAKEAAEKAPTRPPETI
jgi:hypothetical protein